MCFLFCFLVCKLLIVQKFIIIIYSFSSFSSSFFLLLIISIINLNLINVIINMFVFCLLGFKKYLQGIIYYYIFFFFFFLFLFFINLNVINLIINLIPCIYSLK